MIAPPDVSDDEKLTDLSASEREVDELEPPATESPFVDGDIEGLFFPGAGRQQRSEELLHLLRYGPPLLVVHGESGVGKHHLVDYTLTQVDSELFRVAIIEASESLTVNELLWALVDPWQVQSDINRDNYHQLVAEAAKAADEQSQTLVLAVQHAHLADNEVCLVIALLLAATAGLPVKVILVTDGVEPKRWAHLQGLIEHTPNHYLLLLEPFNPIETREYLGYRLHTAGLPGVTFNDAQLDDIYRHSQGNAARINDVASMLLDDSLPAPTPRTSVVKKPWHAAIPWTHFGALAAALVVLIGLLFVWGSNDTDDSVAMVETPIEEPEPRALVTEKEPQVAAPSFEFSDNEISGSTTTETLGVEPEKSTRSDPAASETPAAEEAFEPEVIKPEPVVAEKVTPKEVITPEPQPEVVPPALSDREAWILSRPAEHFGMQVLSAREMATVKRFMANYPSLQNIAYYTTERSGKPWYIIVQGDYVSYQAAKAALAQFPASLQKQQPWIRKFGAIQQDLKK